MFSPASVFKPGSNQLSCPAHTFKVEDNSHQLTLIIKRRWGNEIDSVLVSAKGSKGFVVTPVKLAHWMSIKRRGVSH